MYHTIEREIHIPPDEARFRFKTGVIPASSCSPLAGLADPPTFKFVA
jgi:hypothetical protein